METASAIAAEVPVAVDAALAQAIVGDAVRRYIAERRRRIPGFVARNFSLRGAAALHRRAMGWDMLRVPANVALALPNLARHAAASGAERLGWRDVAARLRRVRMSFPSEVGREIEWRIFDELLELPYAQDGRRRERDALVDEIFKDPRVDATLRAVLEDAARYAEDPRYRGWLVETIETYTGTRTAAADIANSLIYAGAGGLVFRHWTPGALTLGPMLAQAVAHKAAVLSFPLGAGIGSLWFGALPVTPTAMLTLGVTGGLVLLPALMGAFAGILMDPLQAKLGIHRRRLERLVDCLERELLGAGESRLVVRDQYVARVLDLLDLLQAAARFAR